MDITSLPNDVRSLLRSGISINNVLHCVRELVYNSLDAKSTAIAVRINLQNFRIQVVDNGRGITKIDMGFIGVRYMTSKCQTMHDLKHRTKYYGFRGESLASIANVSEKLTVTSKLIDSDYTYCKSIVNKKSSEVVQVRERAEHGTTVTVENFLYNIPVRQGCIRPEQDMESVKRHLELLIVIHPKVSFSLRNDINLKIIVNSNKTTSVLQSFINLHPEICVDYTSTCEISKGNVSISGFIYKKSHVNKNLQLLYVNKRPVMCAKIYRQIKALYKAACKNTEFLQSKDYPVYVLNVSCPYSEIDLLFNSSKTSVEFKYWDLINKCIEKLFSNAWGIKSRDNRFFKQNTADVASCAGISISNMLDVVKTKPLKRKTSEDPIIGESVSQPKFDIIPKKHKTEKKQFVLTDDLAQNRTLHQQQRSNDSSNMNMRIFSYNNRQDASTEIFSDTKSNEILPLNQSCDLEDQTQGKGLIMDYFLKSAVAYPSDYSNKDENKSCSGVCVERTERNFCRRKQDHNTTMTYSVKVTTEKTVKRNKYSRQHNDAGFSNISNADKGELFNTLDLSDKDESKRFFLNKYVQTSFYVSPPKKFASKCVQTNSINNNEEFGASNAFHYYLPEEQKCEEPFKQPLTNVSRYFNEQNYSKRDIACRAKSSSNITPADFTISLPPSPPKPHKNIFSRPFVEQNSNKSRENKLFASPYDTAIERKAFATSMDSNLFSLHNITVSPVQKRKSHFHETSHHFPQNNKHLFDGMSHNATSRQLDNVYNFKIETSDTTPICKQSFEDLFKTKQTGLLGGNASFVSAENLNENTSREDNKNAIGFDDYTKEETVKSTGTEPLLFSVDIKDKQFLLKSDLDAEERLYKRKVEVTQETERVRTNNNDSQCQEDWIKQKTFFGPAACFNKKTGTTVFNVPEEENIFNFKERLDLLPKGCSPIMSAFSKVNKILSPNSKEYLEKTILKSFEEELQMVKWQHYFSNNDWKTFLSELYKEKAKFFEKSIPKAPTAKINSETTFPRRIFDDLQIFAQIDKKFIAVMDMKRKQLFFFDQHAVHERIRVEMLFREYREDSQHQGVPQYRSSHCGQKIVIPLDDYELDMFIWHKTAFNNVGLDFKLSGNVVEIRKVPECFISKIKRTNSSVSRRVLECLVKTLMSEVLQTLKSTKGCLATTPSIITEVINSEACRGAIKFGDSLTYEDMQCCLNSLKQCTLPFQCAHGRPTLTPIVTLEEQVQKIAKPNIKKLIRIF